VGVLHHTAKTIKWWVSYIILLRLSGSVCLTLYC